MSGKDRIPSEIQAAYDEFGDYLTIRGFNLDSLEFLAASAGSLPPLPAYLIEAGEIVDKAFEPPANCKISRKSLPLPRMLELQGWQAFELRVGYVRFGVFRSPDTLTIEFNRKRSIPFKRSQIEAMAFGELPKVILGEDVPDSKEIVRHSTVVITQRRVPSMHHFDLKNLEQSRAYSQFTRNPNRIEAVLVLVGGVLPDSSSYALYMQNRRTDSIASPCMMGLTLPRTGFNEAVLSFIMRYHNLRDPKGEFRQYYDRVLQTLKAP